MIELSDLVALIGVTFVIAGIAAMYWPLALIAFGVYTISVAVAMKRRKKGESDVS